MTAERIILVPTGVGADLASASNAILQNYQGEMVAFAIDRFKSSAIKLSAKGQYRDVLYEIIKEYRIARGNAEAVLVTGFSLQAQPCLSLFNHELVRSLDGQVILVADAQDKTPLELAEEINIATHLYQDANIIGFLPQGAAPEFLQELQGLELACKPLSASTLTITPYNPLYVSWALFRDQLLEKAQKLNKKIVLPEGAEYRTLSAANFCVREGIARCVLIGNRAEIEQTAAQHNITLDPKLEIVEPTTATIAPYIEPLVELRKHKGMNQEQAAKRLQSNILLGTMMLQQGVVDGLVSGANTTTADTIRPVLQLIKMQPEMKKASSVMFMGLPKMTLAFADCALNTYPEPDELADIAIQSADTARIFGIDPRIAMISYSTHQSGMGKTVTAMREAVELVKKRRPDFLIDGPLQYDAALVQRVADTKLANPGQVAGKASVLIFPNLDAANAIYKAVQIASGSVAIGPVLQGLSKPANDLSRGCSVEDAIFLIALTAVQAAG